MSSKLLSDNPDRLDFKKILPVFTIVLIDLLGLTIIIPLLPFYATTFGANAFVIGAIGAAYPLMQFIGAPLLGRISDRVGRRPVLLVSQIGTLVGFLILGFSNTLWMVFLARIIDGISGANIATAQAVITDSTSERNRTQGLGLIGAAFGLGFIIGPIIAFAVLALSNNNYPLVAFVAAGFSFLSILLTYFWLKETLTAEKRGQGNKMPSVGIHAMLGALRKPQVGFLLLLMFAQQFAFGGYENLLGLFTLNRLGMNAANNAALFVFAGIIIVAVQGGLVGLWSRRFGDRWVILMGLAVLGFGLLLTAFTPEQPPPGYSEEALREELGSSVAAERSIQVNLPKDENTGWLGLGWLLLATIPAAIGGGVLQPSINSMLTKQVAHDEVGGTLGLSASFYSAANALAPIVLGFIFQLLGSTAPFLIGGVVLWILWLLAKQGINITT